MTMFRDKVAIVTGGGSGIGQALCQELGQEKAIVVVASKHGNHAERVASAITQNGGRAQAVPVDVSNEEDVRQLINGTVSEFGHLDYLFNNAGIAIGGDARDLTLDQWRSVLAVNLYGELYGTIIAYPIMVQQGVGHIVNVASATGLLPQPINAPYCTSKYGIVGLSLSLRIEGADLGVKVSVVCPGRVQTNLFEAATIANLPPERRSAYEQQMTAPKRMDVSSAARTILRGVARNKAIIIFPANVRLAWRLYRLSPRLLDRLLLNSTKTFRKFRLDS
jgi:NAD(P)-dependent dehydrogenase (short-subunit alcohol dehydrogenase family)